jgi:hypothetical protein
VIERHPVHDRRWLAHRGAAARSRAFSRRETQAARIKLHAGQPRRVPTTTRIRSYTLTTRRDPPAGRQAQWPGIGDGYPHVGWDVKHHGTLGEVPTVGALASRHDLVEDGACAWFGRELLRDRYDATELAALSAPAPGGAHLGVRVVRVRPVQAI